jgi:hypothetical protein
VPVPVAGFHTANIDTSPVPTAVDKVVLTYVCDAPVKYTVFIELSEPATRYGFVPDNVVVLEVPLLSDQPVTFEPDKVTVAVSPASSHNCMPAKLLGENAPPPVIPNPRELVYAKGMQ